ncbi:hypothetical protein KCMC57_up56520 [Kitasatospora sp. CMC57]|uniref:Integral membrane protein n=2 Tax=Kitasatospora sp. CMC57 TaxID=3231513 RepID=A0AB33K606_9ACTN
MRRDLVRRVHREQRGAWFPLLVLAAVRLGGVLVSPHSFGDNFWWAAWYYPVATLLAFGVTAWFYLRRSERLGVGTRVGPYLTLGVLLIVLVHGYQMCLALEVLPYPDFREPTLLSQLFTTVVSPAGVIGLALLLLARIERSWLLLAVTCAYLVLMIDLDGVPALAPWSGWALVRSLFSGSGVLLLGSAALVLQQRFQGRPST